MQFQSLVGFKINWNNGSVCCFLLTLKFQSLVGFKINWNNRENTDFTLAKSVSIPSRV